MKLPTPNLYLESNTNTSFPYTNHTKNPNGASAEGVFVSTFNMVFATALAVAGFVLL